ncbi:MAG: hypothetical protein ACD_79C01283G0010 [uncultured bacterium]|nr:MAG: hypothetical protein ACD_79C01283G0010 [uncultured bacterium]
MGNYSFDIMDKADSQAIFELLLLKYPEFKKIVLSKKLEVEGSQNEPWERVSLNITNFSEVISHLNNKFTTHEFQWKWKELFFDDFDKQLQMFNHTMSPYRQFSSCVGRTLMENDKQFNIEMVFDSEKNPVKKEGMNIRNTISKSQVWIKS